MVEQWVSDLNCLHYSSAIYLTRRLLLEHAMEHVYFMVGAQGGVGWLT